jgi:hypothetical protein
MVKAILGGIESFVVLCGWSNIFPDLDVVKFAFWSTSCCRLAAVSIHYRLFNA